MYCTRTGGGTLYVGAFGFGVELKGSTVYTSGQWVSLQHYVPLMIQPFPVLDI